MAFQLDDIVIDRIQYGVAMSTDDTTLYYVLTQLQDATVEITAESKESRDKDGTLIKKFWTGKSGTFSATNALINLNIIGSASGSGKIQATNEKTITMPAIKVVKAGEVADLTGFVNGSEKVHALAANGTMGAKYTKAASASESAYSLTEQGRFTPPATDGVTQYIIEYNRVVADGVAIMNKADKFPNTVKLVLKVLFVDPCTVDTLRAGYLVLPSFQVSPEISIGLTTDSTIDYTGDLQVSYCDADKQLYSFYFASDDEEDED